MNHTHVSVYSWISQAQLQNKGYMIQYGKDGFYRETWRLQNKNIPKTDMYNF